LATGGTLTEVSGVITLVANTANLTGAVTITNATVDLAGTVETTLDYITSESIACQTTYEITVGTNMVCEECDDIFKDFYISEEPQGYDGSSWELYSAPAAEATDCKCGIRFIGKLWKMTPEDATLYRVPYIEDSVSLEVSAGFSDYTDLQSSGLDFKQPIKTQRIRYKQNRDMVAGHLLALENTNSIYFTDFGKDMDVLRRKLTARETGFTDMDAQFVDYALTINHATFAQGFSNKSSNYITYHFLVEYGRHANIEAELNRLVASAGLPVVNA